MHACSMLKQCIPLILSSFSTNDTSTLAGSGFLQESNIHGYTCVYRSSLCLVYQPNTVHLKNIDIQSIGDTSLYPKTSANEVLLTPVISINSPDSEAFVGDKPIIELMKTAELNSAEDSKLVPMFCNTDNSIPPVWKELDEDICEMLDDRIRFKTSHFSYYAVIARFLPPTATVNVNPDMSGSGSKVELTIPEIPGFSVNIPTSAVQESTKITATLFYDDTDLHNNPPLASAHVVLEPHNHQFSENISVCIPLPHYSEIIASNPTAQPQLMYSQSCSADDWKINEDMEITNFGNEFVAKFATNHFSEWKVVWPEWVSGASKISGNIFQRVKILGCRCQVFMSCVTMEGPVSISALVYPFQDPSREFPLNYRYIVYDSGTFPVKFAPGKLIFSLNLIQTNEDANNQLENSDELSKEFAARAMFAVQLNNQIEDGVMFGSLTIVDGVGVNSNKHECHLIKVLPILHAYNCHDFTYCTHLFSPTARTEYCIKFSWIVM